MKSSQTLFALLALMCVAICAAQNDECADEFLAIRADPNDCSRFFLCMMFERVNFRCDANMIFSLESLSCVRGSWDTCQEFGSGPQLPAGICQDDFFSINQHPNSCIFFYMCLNSEAVVFECDAGHIFYAYANQCIEGNQENCQPSVITPFGIKAIA